MKRIMSVLLVLIIAFSGAGIAVFAEGSTLSAAGTTTVQKGLNYKYLELYKGEKCKLTVNGSSKAKWKSSKNSVATVTSSGTVKAKRVGTTYIRAKKGGKTYKCKVRVVYREPDFVATLYDYSTRGNYFTVAFRNLDTRTLTIISGIKVVDVDYKSYDRKIRLKKKIKIKPRTTKYVRFYVKGRTTWPEVEDFTLYYKFKYDGKTYEGHVWDEDSVFKRNKKKNSWYDTYYNEEYFEEWLDAVYE